MTSETRENAEWCVVGSAVLLPDAAELVSAECTPGMFAYDGPREMFFAIRDMVAAGIEIDSQTFTSRLESTGRLEAAGGFGGVFKAFNTVPHAAHCRHYVTELRGHHQRDELKRLSERLKRLADDPTEDPSDTINAVLSHLETLRDGRAIESELKTAEQALAEYDSRQNDPAGTVETSLPALDARLNGGLRPGQLVVIGGRPGTGKSALMAQMILHNAKQGRPGMVASLEMSAAEHAGRAIRSIRREQFTEMPVLFSEATDFRRLVATITRARRKHGIQIAAIDYLQLLEGDVRKNELRERQVASMSRGLKLLAMRLQIPILLGSQLNRESEKRQRPSLADLRESGAIEQDADIVILIGGDAETDQRELVVAKHRAGPVGLVQTRFDGRTFRFFDEFSG